MEARRPNAWLWPMLAILPVVALVVLLVASSASSGRAYYGMMGVGWGWGVAMMLIPLGVLVLLILVIVEAASPRQVPMAHVPPAPPPVPPASALEILNARYARGEISRDEYLRIRSDLGRGVREAGMSATDPHSDRLYARGEISREEWMQRRSSPTSLTPVPGPRPSGSSRTTWLVVAVFLVVAIVAATAFLASLGARNVPGTNPTYLPLKQLAPADLSALNASATHGLAFAGNNSLWFSPGPVTLVVDVSPPTHDMAFVVQGLLNPTIHVAPGTRVTIVAVNLDLDMYHTWTLATNGPPYGSMPMMGSGGMMGSGSMMGTTMLGPATSQGFWTQQVSFTASAGTYWYLCAVAGHASEGMYGRFVVQ